MQNALNEFEEEAKKIVASFSEDMGSQPPPQFIYHYTNDVGLKGILETGKIWLSDAFSLNDPSELRHGFSILTSILDKRAATKPEKGFAKLMQDSLGRIQDFAQYFICSFSASGDDLGQWRAYADNGHGYALGFNAQALETPFAAQDCDGIPNCATFPVTYDDAKLAGIHQKIVNKMFSLISLPCGENLSEAVLRAYMANLAVLLASHAMHASLFFKDENYRNEREYRFLQVHKAGEVLTDMKLRARPYTLVKYLEFDWKSADPSALKRIVVGPAADRPKAQRFAKDCGDMFYPGIVSIEHSEIPYRTT